MYDDYMSLDKSTSIKGIFILIVVFSHIAGTLDFSVSLLNRAFFAINDRVIGQSMVAMFMLYSGYAVMLSAMKKGKDYVKAMPKNRISKVLLHFDIAVLLFLILQTILGVRYSIGEILLSFTGWESLGNSNWYIFVILILYCISYVSFMISKNNYKLSVVLSFILTVAFIVFLHSFKGVYWWDTSLLYPLGMLYCLYKNKIDMLFKTKSFLYYILFLAFLAATLVLIKFRDNEILIVFKHIFFALTVLLFTMKVQVHNKILHFFGKHLFSIYILHRLPIILLEYLGVSSNHFVFIVSVFVITVILCVPFDLAIAKLDSFLFNKKKLEGDL